MTNQQAAPKGPESPDRRNVVAVVPAAGRGTRLVGRPCSKELLPLSYGAGSRGELAIRVVSQHLFQRLTAAGITRGIVVLREGKWDIPAFYGQGEAAGMALAYVVVGDTAGPPDSVSRAAPFLADSSVAFGFPDLLFGPPDVYARLLSRLDEGDADVVLGLYPVQRREFSDSVALDDAGHVTGLFLKDLSVDHPLCWACAVWAPKFTRFLGSCVQRGRAGAAQGSFAGQDVSGDMPMGWVFQQAVAAGLRVVGVPFPDAEWLDVGSPETLAKVAFRTPT